MDGALCKKLPLLTRYHVSLKNDLGAPKPKNYLPYFAAPKIGGVGVGMKWTYFSVLL